MSKLIFFDTETTGNTEKDFLIQLAYKADNESFSGLYKPPIKIPPEASAVHHITNKMVLDMPSFKDSGDMPKIKKLFEDENSVAVAHNAPFDLMIMNNEGVMPNKFICTLRLARHLDKEGKIERYNLQYLRYYLDLDVDAVAHDAMGDVLVLEKLFERLKNKLMKEENISESEAIEKMIEISSHPTLFSTFNFGKHIGKKIEDVLATDRGYLEWLLAQKQQSDQIEDDWIYTLKHYLEK
jgi:exodeoxyribonuclease X